MSQKKLSETSVVFNFTTAYICYYQSDVCGSWPLKWVVCVDNEDNLFQAQEPMKQGANLSYISFCSQSIKKVFLYKTDRSYLEAKRLK